MAGRQPETYAGYLDQVHSICQRRNPRVARALCVEFMVQLTKIPARRGKQWGQHKIARYLAVDAMVVEGDMALAPVRDSDAQKSVNDTEHARETRGQRFRKIRFLRVVVDGRIKYVVNCWKWLQIICLVTCRPLIGKLIESVGVDVERWQVLELLRERFAWWPVCPAKYLVADGCTASTGPATTRSARCSAATGG